jgi:thymidylate synthase (FAD)
MKAELLDHFGGDLMVANVARESMHKWKTEFDEKDAGLIRWLAKQDPIHWSPFSHPKIQFRITIPFVLARQWEKHRIGAIRGYDLYDQNEVSRRYVDDTPTFFTPDEWRSRPEKSIKQGSGGPLSANIQSNVEDIYADALEICQEIYEALLFQGVAPEQARLILPVSTYTEWVETGSLLYWARLCRQRMDGHAQKEIQQLAGQVAEQIAPLFPVSWPELMR